MLVAALKKLTWGTVAAAVVSALLLAYAGGPRIAGITAEVMRARPIAPASPEQVGRQGNSAPAATRGASSH